MKRIYKATILAGVLFLCNSDKTIAQNNSLRFEHIGVEQGLSSNSVTSIIQDREGYIWIGTEDGGLNKYDGYNFTVYNFDPLDSNSLSQNLIYTIWQDEDGFIWVSTYEGLCKFDPKTEKFTRYKPDPKSKFSDPNIHSINEDKNGTLWIGGGSGQLCRFNKQTGKFFDESFDLGFRKEQGEPLVHDDISCIYKDREGILWVGNYTGLHKLIIQPAKAGQPSPVKITHYFSDPLNPDSLNGNTVQSIFEDHAGVLWITTDGGLNSFDKKTNRFKHYLHDSRNVYSIISDKTGSWPSETIAEDHERNLWITTDKGLAKLNPERTRFYVYRHDASDPNSLKGNHLAAVFVDRSNILWAGSSSFFEGSPVGGLDKALLIQKPFGLRQHRSDNLQSLTDNSVTSLLEDSSGAIWIGTHGGGLNRWDKKTDQFTSYRHDEKNPHTLRYDNVYAMLQDHDGDLSVCNGDQLSLLNRQTGEFIHYNSNVRNYIDFDHFAILSMTQDREGLIWLGTGSGIKSFNKKTGKFKHWYHDPADTSGISDYTAQVIFADSRDNIWIGYGSIATDRFDKKTGRIMHYIHDSRDPSSISSNIVNSFYEDSKGNLWLATTGGGLCRFDYATGKFTSYTDKDGLADNTVFSILEDKKNNLWLGTRKGLSCFDPVKKTCTNYDETDGLQGNYFAAGHRSRPACCRGRDGILYFGGNNGFNFFDPLQITTSNVQAPVVITQFKLFDKLVKGANETKEITLQYNENYFSFEFASLSFYNPEKNRYAYKLEGVDKDWVYSGSRRYAGYTDIGPGTYTFRVKATNNESVWNEQGASVVILIQPPWWRTWWAYCIYALLLVIAAIAVHRYQKQKVIRQEREKAQKKELAQAKEIEKAYHQLKETQALLVQSEKMASLGELTAGIAHEIQNPLNFVNNFSEVNKEMIDELQTELRSGNVVEAISISNDIKDNSEKINHHGKRADAIVKGMLQHSRVSTGKKEPTNINALCDEYLRLSYHGMRAKDKTFNATLQTDFDTSIGKIKVVPQDIGRVLLNLFNNAFYAVRPPNPPKAEENYEPIVSVSTKRINSPLGDGGIEIRVEDNGTGIPQNIVDKIFQPFFTTKPTGSGTGLGLSLAYDIIKAHGGEIKVEAIEGEGSEFVVRLPIV